MTNNGGFDPDWVSPPGDTIADLLAERSMSQLELARLLGLGPERVTELVVGRREISSETANKLESILGAPAAFWMARERQYREDLDRQQSRSMHAVDDDWLSELPIQDMIDFGWIASAKSASEKESACLDFFGVPTVPSWRSVYRDILDLAAFRTSPSFESQPGAVAAWLRQGELLGNAIDCEQWNASRFNETIPAIRSLTREKDVGTFIPALVQLCAGCGVAVVIVRAPRGCRASGATRFLSSGRALLLLSFRYLSDDHFWFTVFHEAGHLLLHSNIGLFLEGANTVSTKHEDEANDFAARVLVPHDFQEELMSLTANGRDVLRFAKRLGISPGIVVGQLQHLGVIRRNQLNTLKRRFVWKQ